MVSMTSFKRINTISFTRVRMASANGDSKLKILVPKGSLKISNFENGG